MNFENTVRAMTAKQIILAMVQGLEKPAVEVRMNTFGSLRYDLETKREICVGCAATNTICRISGITLSSEDISFIRTRARVIKTNILFLADFEVAIDQLRSGWIGQYNVTAEFLGIAKINDGGFELPYLDDDYGEAELQVYRELAEYQETQDVAKAKDTVEAYYREKSQDSSVA